MTTWREELIEALEENNETFEDIISNTMSEEEMDEEVNISGYEFKDEICDFFIWTTNYVYFNFSCDDSSEFVLSVPRNPKEDC